MGSARRFRRKQGTLESFHSQDGKRGPKYQVVRTGFLQPQNFAWSSGPDHSKRKVVHLQKRFYILFVARGNDGQLRKISIPVHYLYVFVVGAAIGFLSLTGIASSYARMLLKVSHYNQLRTEKEQLKDRYSRLEEVAKERDVQVASLGSIASEVSALYGLKSQPDAGHGFAAANRGRRS